MSAMSSKYLQVFAKMGISQAEAKVYLTLLEIGQAKANEVARKARMDRAQTYRILAKLHEEGLIQKALTLPAEFTATPPQKLVSVVLKRKKDEINEIKKSAESLRELEKKKYNESFLQDPFTVFSAKTEAVIDRGKFLIGSSKETISESTSLIRCRQSSEVLGVCFGKALERGVVIKYLVERPTEQDRLPKTLLSLSHHPNFMIKYSTGPVPVELSILDSNKTSIVMCSGEDYFKSSILLTHNRQLVALAVNCFEFMWLKASESEVQRLDTSA